MSSKGNKTQDNAFSEWAANYYIVQKYNNRNLPFKLTYKGLYSFVTPDHYKGAIGTARQRIVYLNAVRGLYLNSSTDGVGGFHGSKSRSGEGHFKRGHKSKSGGVGYTV